MLAHMLADVEVYWVMVGVLATLGILLIAWAFLDRR